MYVSLSSCLCRECQKSPANALQQGLPGTARKPLFMIQWNTSRLLLSCTEDLLPLQGPHVKYTEWGKKYGKVFKVGT